MVNTQLSPGDPIFYLHHSWLDRLWWLWQSKDLSTRLTEIGGVNIPGSTLPPFLGGTDPTFIPPIDPACFARFGGGTGFPFNATNGTTPFNGTVPPFPPGDNPFAGTSPGGGAHLPFTFGAVRPNPGLTDYFNDGGNTTTLNHTLWSVGLLPNATIRDVMDINGSLICLEYA